MKIMPLDFTYGRYAKLIHAIANSEYEVITIKDYILSESLPEKFIILRHDVDLDPYHQLKFAELERVNGISASYYFRFIDKVFKRDVINSIALMGHEVGYHYEVITKAEGDPVRAMQIFRDEQKVFADCWKSKTVCPHGGSFVAKTDGYSLKNMIKLIPKLLSGQQVFSKYVNFDMWNANSFEDYGLIGDAYHSIDFSDILYLSDTGRSWDNRFKRLDKVSSRVNQSFTVNSTNDIIDIIKGKKTDKIYLLVHFEQWKDNVFDWLSWYAAQVIRRVGKRVIFRNK